ncbi:serine/threonine-protein phosphatase 6 regulatory ankyrin repeat subunit A-like [Macrobrachium nipponense]|uniref:serine/threonine-protein phosphatase 6 regulatory ankyrin repeat subunit A-like n=1 Tax=Macrobrachium nipponense TaxID=159736 RepID=UPI0030C86E3F
MLHLAALKGHRKLVKLFISKGANISDKNNNGRTPLHAAVESGHVSVVHELIESGARVDVHDSEQCTPMYLATYSGYILIMKTLLQAKANIYYENEIYKDMGDHHNAALGGKCGVIIGLLESTFDVNCKTKKGDTMLHLAALKGHRELVQLLISKGANVNDKNNIGWTALHVHSNDVSVVQELIESGATADAHDNQQWTPLHLATSLGYILIMKTLIQASADIYDIDTYGYMGGRDAALGGKCDAITVLLESGFDVNCKTKEGSTMLHLASGKGHRELVQLLISKGVNVND